MKQKIEDILELLVNITVILHHQLEDILICLFIELFLNIQKRIIIYPDIFIHRIISEYIKKGYNIDEERLAELQGAAEKYAETSSEAEKLATKAEREAEDIKKAEFMEDKIGEEYFGIVSSITAFGMFVELESTVEGLIRFENMGNEYFIYDENRKTLTGERTNRSFKIGDQVKIRVIAANKELRKIAFELVEEDLEKEEE